MAGKTDAPVELPLRTAYRHLTASLAGTASLHAVYRRARAGSIPARCERRGTHRLWLISLEDLRPHLGGTPRAGRIVPLVRATSDAAAIDPLPAALVRVFEVQRAYEPAHRALLTLTLSVALAVTGDLFCMETAALFARQRDPERVKARTVCWHLLLRHAVGPAEISRAFAMNHATVVHGLRKDPAALVGRVAWERAVEQVAERIWVVAPEDAAAYLPTPDGSAAHLESRLHRLLDGQLSPPQVADVLAYARSLLSDQRRPGGGDAARGLYLLATRPALRADVVRVLAVLGTGHLPQAVERHLRQAGWLAA